MNALAPNLESLPAEVRDRKIMAMCDRAIADLREARTIEDVKRVGDMAAAFAAYTRKMKAALEAQNQCQLVVLLAEARIGAELKAAQQRGEVATQEAGRPVSVRASDTSPATLPDLGIPRQRASEMKKLAEAGPERIQHEVQRATAEGRKPSRQRLIAAIPAIAARPPECSQFVLWLRSGAGLIPHLGGADSFRALMEQHAMEIRQDQLGIVLPFLAALEHGEEA
jgi:hypothetical protein